MSINIYLNFFFKMDSYCKKKSSGYHHMFCGDPLFAKCDEEQRWMRAVVIECHGRSSQVLFVDNGLESEVEEVREANLEMVQSVKAQAIECYLTGLEINAKAASVLKTLISNKV